MDGSAASAWVGAMATVLGAGATAWAALQARRSADAARRAAEAAERSLEAPRPQLVPLASIANPTGAVDARVTNIGQGAATHVWAVFEADGRFFVADVATVLLPKAAAGAALDRAARAARVTAVAGGVDQNGSLWVWTSDGRVLPGEPFETEENGTRVVDRGAAYRAAWRTSPDPTTSPRWRAIAGYGPPR